MVVDLLDTESAVPTTSWRSKARIAMLDRIRYVGTQRKRRLKSALFWEHLHKVEVREG